MKTNIKYFKNLFVKDANDILILNQNDKYTENFGKQWRDYRDIQIDSLNDFKISKEYLNDMIFDDLSLLENKTILEIGSGAGRFTEYLVKYAKKCVSIDLSSAIYHNVSSKKENIILIKADFNELIANEKFDIVFCRGVLQHTPKPLDSIIKIHSFVKKEGKVFFDIYKMPKIGYLHPKYFIWRPLIKNFIKYENFEKFLHKNINLLFRLKIIIKKIFFNSNFISDSFLPLWDYNGIYKIDNEKLKIWSIMDTLDGLYAKYDYPQSTNRVKNLLQKIILKFLILIRLKIFFLQN